MDLTDDLGLYCLRQFCIVESLLDDDRKWAPADSLLNFGGSSLERVAKFRAPLALVIVILDVESQMVAPPLIPPV